MTTRRDADAYPLTVECETVAGQDATYFHEREAFAARWHHHGLWHVMDHWPLYVGRENLARCLVILDALRHVSDIPGDVVEVGAWRGATTCLLAKALLATHQNAGKRVHAFDTWAGFVGWGPHDSADTEAEFRGPEGQRFVDGFDELTDLCRLYRLPVTLHRGRVETTVSEAVAHTPGWRVSLVYLDVDLYEPTLAALEALHPIVSKGGIILCDQYGHPRWPGETEAVDRFLRDHPEAYATSAMTGARQPTFMLLRQ